VLPNIDYLVLGSVHLCEFPPPPSVYRLKAICLNQSGVTDETLPVLMRGLPHLVGLGISRCTFRDLRILSAYTNLESFTMDYASINDFALVTDALGALPRLKTLSLNGNQIVRLLLSSIHASRSEIANLNETNSETAI
jgi:Leucine-rich repeat (LRR) protein